MSLVRVDDDRTIFNGIIHYKRCFNSDGAIIAIRELSARKWSCSKNLIGVDGICSDGDADRWAGRLMAEYSLIRRAWVVIKCVTQPGKEWLWLWTFPYNRMKAKNEL